MRKILIVLALFLAAQGCFSAELPKDVKNIVMQNFPETNFRFDGVIILPDNTIYLPVIPAKIINPETLEISSTIPEGKTLSQKPDVVIFNNDYVLLKVLEDKEGKKSIIKLQNPPHQLKSGLLPQDMLVPHGLAIPENIKGIIGNLEITTINEPTLKVIPAKNKGENSVVNSLSEIPQLKNKISLTDIQNLPRTNHNNPNYNIVLS